MLDNLIFQFSIIFHSFKISIYTELKQWGFVTFFAIQLDNKKNKKADSQKTYFVSYISD